MAQILVVGHRCVATLSEPDNDGEYRWTASCGAGSEPGRTDILGDAAAHAEAHVDGCDR